MTRTNPDRLVRGGEILRLGGAWLLALLALSACKVDAVVPETPTPTPEPTPTAAPPPVILQINLGSPPVTIDPGLVAPPDVSGNDLVANLFAALAQLDGDTGQVLPLLAKEWTSDDQIVWRVSLRDDMWWVHINPDTGQLEQVRPVKAGDAVAAARRACRGDTGAPMIHAALLIKGCAEINEKDPAQVTDEDVAKSVAVRALNDTELEYTLVGPAAFFPTILSMPVLAPVPEELVAQEKENWARPDKLWTSGPFTVRPGVPPEQGYALVENSFWPIERTGNVAGLEVVFDAQAERSLAGLNAGEVALTTLPPDQIARVSFEDDPRYRLLVGQVVTFIAISYDTPPFENEDLRRAFALALDRQVIVKSILAPQGVAALPALALIPPGSAGAPGYNEVGANTDIEAAQAALAKAGYSKCARMPQVTLLTEESALSKTLATEYVRQWTENLGCPQGVIKVEAKPLQEVEVALRIPPEDRRPRRAGLITLGWQVEYPDSYHWLADFLGCREKFPDAYLDQKRPCGSADNGIVRAADTADPNGRSALYKSIENALFGPEGDMPVIPVYYEARALAIGAHLEVYPVHAGPLRFDQWKQGE